MMVQDRQIRELQERKNDLESYIYSMRDRVTCGNLQEYIAQADKDVFVKMLDEVLLPYTHARARTHTRT